ncbi:MAG TPA: hypothetical protein VLV83_26450 [Acidobacteriota bacterium]|nr:hypothetical protein [Acidobacteriota bacterium]
MKPIIERLGQDADLRTLGPARELAEEVVQQPEMLEEVIEAFLSDDKVLRSRAGHILKKAARECPEEVQPYKQILIEEASGIQQMHVREAFTVSVMKLDLSPNDIPQLFEIFLSYLQDRASVVRTVAMQGLVELCELEPRYYPRVTPLIERLTRTGSAAMRARGRHLLKRLGSA